MREAQPASAPPTATAEANGPVRTCVGCRRTRPRGELARLARTPDGTRFDRRQRMPGRGAYVCPDPTCLEAAAKRGAGAIRRALRGAPEREVRGALDALRAEVAERRTGAVPPSTERPHRDEPSEAPHRGDQVPDGTVRSHRT